MKFIRNAKLRDRILDFLSRALLIGLSVLACLWMVSGAHAGQGSITGIKGQLQPDGSYFVDFSLTQRISPKDVTVEFERNFIQVSLKGVSAYPARTETIQHSVLEKVFTYQYQPDLARARVLLKVSANSLRSRASWEVTGNGLRINLKGAGDEAHSISDSLKTSSAAASEPNASVDSEEERIVQEILNETKGGKTSSQAAANTSKAASEEAPLFAKKPDNFTNAPSAASSASTEDQAIFTAKNSTESGKGKEGAATRIVASLLLVIGLIGASAVAYRRFALGKGMPFQRQAKVIDVIASQSLGPKRSIALVKVLDQYMVVGMAGDGMSLLANLGADVKVEKYLDQIGGPGSSFLDTFEGALAGGPARSERSDVAGSNVSHKVAEVNLGIRGAIKKRIEGFKPL